MGWFDDLMRRMAGAVEVQEVQGQDVEFNVIGNARRNLTRALRLLQCRDSLDSAGLVELNARLAHARKNGVDVSSVESIQEALDGCV